MAPSHVTRWSVVAVVLAGLAFGCSGGDSGTPVVPGADAGAVSDLGAPPVDVPAAPDVAIDVTADTGPADVTIDAGPADAGPSRCATNADCADAGTGGVCDVASGRCVQCVPTADACPAAQHCDPASSTCVAGCRSDEGCAAGGDAGAAASHCDTTTHACVQCASDAHCAAGSLCVGSVCVTGCNASRQCPTGQVCCSGACVDTGSNVAHCGACDATCRAANASPACTNATCAVGECTAPFADCDRTAANGCESNSLTDPANCGGCGMACAARPNASASCAAGRCVYECAAGFADCDGEASNGCEVDTRTSAAHCGACGRGCTPPNATAACVMGACTVGSCNANFGDCDSNATNGCETDTRGATAHCGGCGMACAARDNALPGCVASACVFACLGGYADCDGSAMNGCEVDTRTSGANCGGCGRECSLPNGASTCAGGACVLGACSAGFGNCDGMGSNGCETSTATAAAHCGMCGRQCPSAANASPACAASNCGFTCNPGFGDCDGNAANGCETDLGSAAAHCGRCANACTSGVCSGGACQAPSCTDRVRNGSETDVDCGGACPRCALCQTCAAAGDCAAGACSAAGRCTFRSDVYVDWVQSCRGAGGGAADVVVPGVPAGTYQVTALSSAGTVWNPVSYPSTGWFWNLTCENLSVPDLATPSGVLYPTPEAAFAALPRTTATANFAGGALRCYFVDNPCSDNQGGARFRIERTCP